VNFDENNRVLGSKWRSYLEQFRNSDDDVDHADFLYLGDATPCMVFPNVAERIKNNCSGESKIIICLRDPVKRAYSHFWHGYRLGLEDNCVESALIDEAAESVKDTGLFPKYYLLNGRYWLHIDRFVKEFGIENVLLLKFERLIENSNLELGRVWDFLGLDQKEVENRKDNSAMLPRFPFLQRFLSSQGYLKSILKMLLPSQLRARLVVNVSKANMKVAQYNAIDSELKNKLGGYFYDDNIILREKYNFDISGWTAKDGETFNDC